MTGSVRAASQQDVSFVVLGKTTNHRQSPDDGSHHLLNFHFFAEIFLQKGVTVFGAMLHRPGEAEAGLEFVGDGLVLEVHGGRYRSEDELDQAFPDGDYVFFYTPSDGVRMEQPVAISSPGGHSRIPPPITITLFQDGHAASLDSIDPEKNITVGWSEFESGNSDPNGIVDDLVFVITGNCHGERIDHSGRPFGDSPYLTYADTEYVVAAKALFPGEVYQLAVEQAEMETTVFEGVPQIATWAETSFIEFTTSGDSLPGRAVCPDVMFAMDGGQTDRPRKNTRQE